MPARACCKCWPDVPTLSQHVDSRKLDAAYFRVFGPVAQGIEQQPSKLKVAGSNPAGVAKYFNGLDGSGLAFVSLQAV
jgi:hypothetical protein